MEEEEYADLGFNGTEEGDEEYTFGDYMAGVEDEVKEMIKNKSKGPETFSEELMAFYHAVDWSERWIQIMLISHLVLFIITVLTRRNVNIQTVIFLLICASVGLAERMNGWCAAHWQEFSKQNYFDERGVFTGTLFCAPLLLIAFFQLISILILTSNTLIKAKRMELRQKLKKNKEAEQKETSKDIKQD
jgi:hypothetical protein